MAEIIFNRLVVEVINKHGSKSNALVPVNHLHWLNSIFKYDIVTPLWNEAIKVLV